MFKEYEEAVEKVFSTGECALAAGKPKMTQVTQDFKFLTFRVRPVIILSNFYDIILIY